MAVTRMSWMRRLVPAENMLELWTLMYDRATNRTIDNAYIHINFSTIMDALVVSLFETYKRSIKLSQVVG